MQVISPQDVSRITPTEVTSYIGGFISVVSSLTLTEIGVIIGIATALLTFVLNLVYTYRRDRREERESRARLASLEHPNG